MATPRFNLPAVFAAVDKERERQGLAWTALSREVGVAVSTIRRFETADDAEADGVLAVVRWLGVAPENFVVGWTKLGVKLPEGDGYVRVDMDAVAQAAGDARGAAGRTRTTIQKLVSAADRAGRPIASLTRVAAY